MAAAGRLAAEPARIGRGPGKGLAFDPGNMNPGYILGTTEPAIQNVLAEHLQPGDIVLDIGAASGFYSLLAARIVGPRGFVYAFEPLPASADLVEANARANSFDQIRVLRTAVSDNAGTGFLLVDREANHSRLVPGRLPGASEVQLVSIDDLVEAALVQPPQFVKIDVEGAELEVLRGMRHTIASHRPTLLAELHWVGPTFVELAKELLQDYELVPISDDPSFRLDAIAYGHVLATPR